MERSITDLEPSARLTVDPQFDLVCPWPDEIREEVLARLLKLNAERAEQEKLSGEAVAAAKPKRARGKKSVATPAQGDLIRAPQKDLFG